MHGNVWEWTADGMGTYSSRCGDRSLRVRLRARTVSFGVVLGRYGHGLAFSLPPPQRPQPPLQHVGFRVGFQQIPADVASPEMQIFGDANITHLQDTAWVDPGVEAHDVRDGNITSDVVVSGTVDVNTTGTYTLTYTVSGCCR